MPSGLTTEDQQKYKLSSILIPTKLKNEKETGLEECAKDSYVSNGRLSIGEESTYTITLSFNDRIPVNSTFLSSSLTGHIMELSEDRDQLLIHLCGKGEKDVVDFYENYLKFNGNSTEKLHVVFFIGVMVNSGYSENF